MQSTHKPMARPAGKRADNDPDTRRALKELRRLKDTLGVTLHELAKASSMNAAVVGFLFCDTEQCKRYHTATMIAKAQKGIDKLKAEMLRKLS